MANTPTIQTPEQLQENMLRTYRSSMIINGHSGNPNVSQGSDIFNTTLSVANELGVALANVINSSNSLMPDTATGIDLDRIMATYGLIRQPAAPAFGIAQMLGPISSVGVSVFIPTGSRLVDENGIIFNVTTGGDYLIAGPGSGTDDNRYNIPIQSQNTGAVNYSALLTWIDTPATAPQVAQSLAAAFVPGTDIETDSNARGRLLDTLQNPKQFGNWSDLAQLVDVFKPFVIQKSFIYPCADGPGTQHIAIQKNIVLNATSFSKEVSDIYLEETNSYVQGSIPSSTNTVVTTINGVPFDLTIGLSIPYPIGAPNNGSGGGWVNYNPFPSTNATLTNVNVDSNPNKIRITIVSGIALPQNNISKVAVFTYNGVKTFTVISQLLESPTSLVITADIDLSALDIGSILFPSCVNAQAYCDNVVNYFNLMGPGQKTNIPGLLPRALRQPPVAYNYPDKVDSRLLKSMNITFPEINDSDFIDRTSIASPAIPSDINDPPNMWQLQFFGFYPITD